jgi:hypothetical protein
MEGRRMGDKAWIGLFESAGFRRRYVELDHSQHRIDRYLSDV